MQRKSKHKLNDDPPVSDEKVIQPLLHRISEPHLLFPLTAIIGLILIWGATFNVIQVTKTGTEQTLSILGRELAETYEAQAIRAFREIDQTLKIVKYVHAQGKTKSALQQLKEKDLLLPEILFTTSIADRHGKIIDTIGNVNNGQVADKDIFISQIQQDSFTVGLPQINQNNGEWELQFSHRLNADNGDFDGIVFITVAASYFVSGYETNKLGEKGILAIIGTDNVLRIARSSDNTYANVSIDYQNIIDSITHDVSDNKIYITPWDNVSRYIYVREFYNLPLAILVGLSVDEQYSETEKLIDTYLLRAVLMSVSLLFVLFILGRLSHQLSVSRKQAIKEQTRHSKAMQHIAYHDSLTSLPNRTSFSNLLTQSLKQSRRYNKQLAVMFIDLDGFKAINDTLGHDAGDLLLIEVSKRLNTCLRDSDMVARLGGDEFVALLPELEDEQYITIVADKILTVLAKPVLILGKECFITGSIGISIFPQDGLDEQTLTKNADIAMYQAKENGKNNYQIYSSKLNNALLERTKIETALRHALEKNEFNILYQVKRNANSKLITGVEALLRWNNPILGALKPIQFLSIAENNGTIIPIGKWVIKTACKQNIAWQKSGAPEICMSVNLTAKQFFDKNLIPDLKQILEETGMPANLLELEIKENFLEDDIEKALTIMHQLKTIGLKIAIDNFGISFSSLLTLKKFPLDTIKIDRLLIKELTELTNNDDLPAMIINTGKELNLNILAQGIETEEQISQIEKHKYDEYQGYYFGKPATSTQITNLFEEQRFIRNKSKG